jgi:hypothetical protein
MRARWLTLAAALLVCGCFKSTVRSGHAPGDPPDQWDHRWHSGWLFGAIEVSGPYDLGRVCPAGWSEIDTVTDPSQALITLLTLGIYAPQSVTVVCAAEPRRTLAPPLPKSF